MKNLNKLVVGLFLGLGLMSLAKPSYANYAIAPKEVFTTKYSTTITTFTAVASTNTVAANQYAPGAVYEVTLASGAASEYFQMYDSTGTFSISTCGVSPDGTAPFLGPRLLFGSTTAITQIKFDPPLVFHNGLVYCDSAATGQAAVTYELGRGLSGN